MRWKLQHITLCLKICARKVKFLSPHALLNSWWYFVVLMQHQTDLLLNFDRRVLLNNARTQFKPTHVSCWTAVSICQFAVLIVMLIVIAVQNCMYVLQLVTLSACICVREVTRQINAGILILEPHDNIIFLCSACGNCCWQNWQMTRNSSWDFSLLIFYTLGSIIFQTSNLLFCRHNKYIVCMMMRAVCELRKAGIYV